MMAGDVLHSGPYEARMGNEVKTVVSMFVFCVMGVLGGVDVWQRSFRVHAYEPLVGVVMSLAEYERYLLLFQEVINERIVKENEWRVAHGLEAYELVLLEKDEYYDFHEACAEVRAQLRIRFLFVGFVVSFLREEKGKGAFFVGLKRIEGWWVAVWWRCGRPTGGGLTSLGAAMCRRCWRTFCLNTRRRLARRARLIC